MVAKREEKDIDEIPNKILKGHDILLLVESWNLGRVKALAAQIPAFN
jgi:hypothetical protein